MGPSAPRVLPYFTAPPAAPAIFPQLTDREREVLELVAQGRSNADIAGRLQLSQKTVRNHVSNILTKLQVADRAQAIVRARDACSATRPAPERRNFPAIPGQPTDDNGTRPPRRSLCTRGRLRGEIVMNRTQRIRRRCAAILAALAAATTWAGGSGRLRRTCSASRNRRRGKG